MSIQVELYEVEKTFAILTDAVEAGEEVIIARAGIPVMKMIPIQESQTPINFGFAAKEFESWNGLSWERLDKEFLSLFGE